MMSHQARAAGYTAFSSSPVPFRSPLAANRPIHPRVDAAKKSANASTPPGHQFMTSFDCKYYGTSAMAEEQVAHVSGKQVTRLVREAITANERQHNKVNFQITDKGVSITPVGVSKCGEISLAADKLRRIVPGTLKTKSGKSFRVALVIEKSPSENGMITYHVFQFKRDGDVRSMYEASKRMWRDHMFSELLDVSTEGGQNAWDSFSIERDIEMVTNRCAELMSNDEDMFSFESVINGLAAQ